jgi:hypothetical protein
VLSPVLGVLPCVPLEAQPGHHLSVTTWYG